MISCAGASSEHNRRQASSSYTEVEEPAINISKEPDCHEAAAGLLMILTSSATLLEGCDRAFVPEIGKTGDCNANR